MTRLFRSLIVAAVLLALGGGASAAFASPKVDKSRTEVGPGKTEVELPADAKGTPKAPAKKPDLCDFVDDILSRTRFPDGTTPAQVKQHVIDVLATTRLPDGVDTSKPIDSCFPKTGTDKPKPTKGDPNPEPGSKSPTERTGIATTAPIRSATPNFAG